MVSKKKKQVSFHVDLDSPLKLLDFYGFKNVRYTTQQLDDFYTICMSRMLDFFGKNNIKATFFIVGDDLERSVQFQKMIQMAHNQGHELANHTCSHPFGLSKMKDEEIIDEIRKCDSIIKDLTGSSPVGFRAPGYDISSKIINILNDNGYIYDSSVFWSIINPIIKLYHRIHSKSEIHSGFGENSFKLPKLPYHPNKHNILKGNNPIPFVEIPLPTNNFLLPYYSNFHLMYPNFIFKNLLKSLNHSYFVYLFHAIEFMDMTDNIPNELSVHSNIKTPVNEKLDKFNKIINTILESHEYVRTDIWAKNSIEENQLV